MNPDTTPAAVIAVAAFVGWAGLFIQAWWIERRRK